MNIDNLAGLIEAFKPKRTFSCSHTTVEVDGVFVRVDDEEEGGWKRLDDGSGRIYYRIDAEDLMQDPAIVRSARVSTDRDTTAVTEKAAGLVNYLYRDHHVTPSETGVHFRLRVTIPIQFAQAFFRLFVAQNEFSGRYSKIDTPYYLPKNLDVASRGEFLEAETEGQGLYSHLLGLGVATEMARYAHLYRFNTKFYMTISLRHLLEYTLYKNVPNRHETTEYGELGAVFAQVIEHWAPWAFKAWQDNDQSLDFSWIKGVLPGVKHLSEYESIGSVRVLDRGEVRLLEVFGSEEFMLSALDDFPDPRRAFGHAGMRFFLWLPIHVFRQWVRHRYGHWTEPRIDFDQITRERLFYIPERFRQQTGKVGAYTYEDMPNEANSSVRYLLELHIHEASRRYQRLREQHSLSSEVAALNLPYCFYIPVGWTVSVEGLLNFFSLRCDSHAQYEIRQYANVVWKMFREAFPRVAVIFAKHLHYGNSPTIKALAEQ